MRSFIAGLKLFCLFFPVILLIPPQLFFLTVFKGHAVCSILPRIWHKMMCFFFCLKKEIVGRPIEDRQVFFVGNHLSHFDIPVLGSIVRASFVSKDEVARWPGVNILAWLSQTAYISRSPKQAISASRSVAAFLDEGKSIILFPEGTSTRGDTVLPFKSSLFSLALGEGRTDLVIQPFSLEMVEVAGRKPVIGDLKDIYAWDRDNPIPFGAHAWNFLKTGGARIRVRFHDPLDLKALPDRKALALAAWQAASKPLEQTTSSV